MTALRDEVVAVLAERLHVPADRISDTSRLAEDLGADSLQRFELVFVLEDRMGVEISDEQLERIRTVADVVRVIETNRA
jgi:acyl carrier protein